MLPATTGQYVPRTCDQHFWSCLCDWQLVGAGTHTHSDLLHFVATTFQREPLSDQETVNGAPASIHLPQNCSQFDSFWSPQVACVSSSEDSTAVSPSISLSMNFMKTDVFSVNCISSQSKLALPFCLCTSVLCVRRPNTLATGGRSVNRPVGQLNAVNGFHSAVSAPLCHCYSARTCNEQLLLNFHRVFVAKFISSAK